VLDQLLPSSNAEGTTSWRARLAQATYGQIVRTSDALLNEFALFAFLAAPRPNSRPR